MTESKSVALPLGYTPIRNVNIISKIENDFNSKMIF